MFDWLWRDKLQTLLHSFCALCECVLKAADWFPWINETSWARVKCLQTSAACRARRGQRSHSYYWRSLQQQNLRDTACLCWKVLLLLAVCVQRSSIVECPLTEVGLRKITSVIPLPCRLPVCVPPSPTRHGWSQADLVRNLNCDEMCARELSPFKFVMARVRQVSLISPRLMCNVQLLSMIW